VSDEACHVNVGVVLTVAPLAGLTRLKAAGAVVSVPETVRSPGVASL
jgi:hypothetical protein